jgi:4-alpha-glucanotransferase
VNHNGHWDRVGKKSHHGIAISLASLRSKKSSGVGEFFDLLPLIDWCRSIGLDVIQLLPLNDTGNDPSPYNALSSCALDPIYLSLSQLPEAGPLAHDLDEFISLTKMDRIAYNTVKHQKIHWLTRYFHRQFESVVGTHDYQTFLHNHPWVRVYALFKAHKDEYGGKNWKDWPESARTLSLSDMEDKRESVEFHSFLQYLCYTQMTQVKTYASTHGVLLKGDVPILLSPDSADVWAEPHLFDQTLAAGAPPDAYNRLGQKWGFPLYDWKAMEQENFGWWKRRLSTMGEYFHIYRVDHVVGFFRIWAIPKNKKPAEGHFVPKDPTLWPEHGRILLQMMLDASPLLPMAEDLGTIPRFVPEILKELQICSTKVLRWQRNWDTDKNFIPYDHYEPLSLTTVSTHDSDTLTLWWKKFPDEAIPFAHFKHWTYNPDLTQDQRFEILSDAHHTSSYFHINILQETLALFPELVWPNPEDERLNIPGTLLPTNWTYRYRPYIEELLAHPQLTQTFRKLIS